ncbi:nitroreductase [Rhizobium subbaraonis]|uniref:Nitroreductase n=1 Tax=Rhizobium subbaraonis TaxID=908946 RepID=A0A285UA78_9HYPH|nr:nitroreductase family protein [Rhizobium subbaraonis]SOC37221.1 nitroreductase [Rhizobium subbaraonis]
MIAANSRKADHSIDPLFLNRWSPRAYSGETMPESDLLAILEAAHWAPSAYNSQPWRFVYALRDTAEWNKLFPILNDFNQSWAKSASALIVIISKSHFLAPGASEESLSYSHSFDTGAAWGALSLQAQLSGYQAHGMTGIHFDKARQILQLPEGYRVEAAAVVGRIGDKSQLPQFLQARETPSPRRPLSEVVFNGNFPSE